MIIPMRWRDVNHDAVVVLPSGEAAHVGIDPRYVGDPRREMYRVLTDVHGRWSRFEPVDLDAYVPVIESEPPPSDPITDAMAVLLMAGFTLEHPDPTQRGSAR